jgi:hypothetical protein
MAGSELVAQSSIRPHPKNESRAHFHRHFDGSITYTVKPGDTLSEIGRQAFEFMYGRTPEARELLSIVLHIHALNQLHGQLKAGQVLEWDMTFNRRE